MRNRSEANSAASSPPVPARISRMMFLASFGSFGTSRTFISASSASRRCVSSVISSCASSRMSGSLSISSVAAVCATTSLYSRKVSTSSCMSATPLESVRNFELSAWTAGSAISAVICSYLASIDCSFSNIHQSGALAPDPLTLTRCARSLLSAARYGWQECHFVTVAEQRRQPRVLLVDRARDASAVVLHRGELCDQRVPRVVRRRALGQLPRQRRRAGQLAQPREQADVYVH